MSSSLSSASEEGRRPSRIERKPFPALPGGYAIPADFGRTTSQWLGGNRPVTTEGIALAAARKLWDETGIILPVDTPAKIVRAIRPVSTVHTLNSWTVTFTVLFTVSSVRDLSGDPERTTMVSVEDAYSMMPKMWADHRRALDAALAAFAG